MGWVRAESLSGGKKVKAQLLGSGGVWLSRRRREERHSRLGNIGFKGTHPRRYSWWWEIWEDSVAQSLVPASDLGSILSHSLC